MSIPPPATRRQQHDLKRKGDPGKVRLASVLGGWGRLAAAASLFLSPKFNQLLALLQPVNSVLPERLKPN